MPRESCPPHGVWSGDDAGRTPRYPGPCSPSEGGADACTEGREAARVRGGASHLGPGPAGAADRPASRSASASGRRVGASGSGCRLVLALARALRCGGTGAVAVSVWPGPLAGNARGVRLGDRAPRTHTAGGPLVPAVAGLSSDHAGRLAVSLGLSNLPRLGAQAGAGHAAEPPRGGNALCG